MVGFALLFRRLWGHYQVTKDGIILLNVIVVQYPIQIIYKIEGQRCNEQKPYYTLAKDWGHS